jgi:hypothetical protein
MDSFGKKLFIPFILFALVFIAIKLFPEKTIEHPPGILVNEIPEQVELDPPIYIEKGDYIITAKATFNMKGRILSIETYNTGRESDLSPIDFAMGWGPMSDQAVLDKIDISQSRRWYKWKTNRYPIPRRQIEVNSANMHIIPANDKVEDKLNDLYQGNVVQLVGYLVYVKGRDNWFWKSSLTREDTGNHACEVFYVEEVIVLI